MYFEKYEQKLFCGQNCQKDLFKISPKYFLKKNKQGFSLEVFFKEINSIFSIENFCKKN